MTSIQESSVNIVSEGTRIEGEVVFDQISRIYGVLVGKVKAKDGSTLILSETAVVEGTIEADTLIIDGYVQGEIKAKTKTVISRTGRVIGNILTGNLSMEFGAYFEGKCSTGSS